MKSKLLSLFLLIAANIFLFNTGKTQNLISNPSFEDSTGQLACQSWYDACNRELLFLCDTIFPDTICSTLLYQDAPQQGGNWCLMVQGMGNTPGGYSTTYITDQSGTNAYELKIWMKKQGNGSGSITISTISQGQVTIGNSVSVNDTAWNLYTFNDTLTLQTSDTIAVSVNAIAAGPNMVSILCDMIELKKNDFNTTLISEEKYADANFNIRIYPNPTTGKFNLEINALQKFNAEIEEVLLLNINGQIIFTEKLNTTVNNFSKEIELTNNGKGLYYLQIITKNEMINKKIIIE